MQEMFGEADPTLDAAALKIAALGPDALGGPVGAPKEREPANAKNENRTDRDPIEREPDGDLEEPKAQGAEEDEGAEKGADAEKQDDEGGAEAADFLEIPGADGAEPEKVPLTEAVEAIKQIRELRGDIKQAVNRAEDEVREKATGTLQQLAAVHQKVFDEADTILRAMPQPRPPPRSMLDRNHPDYDPESYHLMNLRFEEDRDAIEHVRMARADAITKHQEAQTALMAEANERENRRLTQYLPDWAEPDKREGIMSQITKDAAAFYGVPAHVIEAVPFHHGLVRAMRDALEYRASQSKAGEVRKEVRTAVKEKAPKIVRGQAQQARAADGKFAGANAMKDLQKSGSEADMAKFLLQSGMLR